MRTPTGVHTCICIRGVSTSIRAQSPCMLYVHVYARFQLGRKKNLICVRISTVFHVEMKTYLHFLSHVCLHTHYTLYTHTCRNKSYDSELRYSRTLSVLHQLYVLCRGGKLPEESVMKIFPLVIPDWLDLLVKLRSEPGKMERLQDKFKYVG